MELLLIPHPSLLFFSLLPEHGIFIQHG
uniref:65-kDa microtubule-associated protein 1-like n=1 Tax=Rhizophora mucronata TaxID=61149 RepID=A0A2P2JGZ8_RHIMU